MTAQVPFFNVFPKKDPHINVVGYDVFKHVIGPSFFSSSRFFTFSNSTVIPVGHQVDMFVLSSLVFVNALVNGFWAGSNFIHQ